MSGKGKWAERTGSGLMAGAAVLLVWSLWSDRSTPVTPPPTPPQTKMETETAQAVEPIAAPTPHPTAIVLPPPPPAPTIAATPSQAVPNDPPPVETMPIETVLAQTPRVETVMSVTPLRPTPDTAAALPKIEALTPPPEAPTPEVLPPEALPQEPIPEIQPLRASPDPAPPEPPRVVEPAPSPPAPEPSPVVQASELPATPEIAVAGNMPDAQATERQGRVLLRLMEHDAGPSLTIDWPSSSQARERLYRVLTACYGVESALMDGSGGLYFASGAAGQPTAPDMNRFSGFVRAADGALPMRERSAVQPVFRHHGLTAGAVQVVRLFPRAADARMLGGLAKLLDGGLTSGARVQARYEWRPDGLVVTGIRHNGAPVEGRVIVAPIQPCGEI